MFPHTSPILEQGPSYGGMLEKAGRPVDGQRGSIERELSTSNTELDGVEKELMGLIETLSPIINAGPRPTNGAVECDRPPANSEIASRISQTNNRIRSICGQLRELRLRIDI